MSSGSELGLGISWVVFSARELLVPLVQSTARTMDGTMSQSLLPLLQLEA